MLIKNVNIPQDLWDGIYQTGSSVICDPPVLDTDIDYIVYTNEETKLDAFLKCEGFTKSSSEEEDYDMESEGFSCYRRDNLNLIVTISSSWYNKWVLATRVAKALNLRNKADRVMLFKAFLYEEAPNF